MSVIQAHAQSDDSIDVGDIGHSLRLRASASAYLSKTFGTPTNREKWSLFLWIKRGTLGVRQSILCSGTSGSQYADFRFSATDKLEYTSENGGLIANMVSTRVFRDPSAHVPILFVYDQANGTSAHKLRMYIGADEITAWDTATYPSMAGDVMNYTLGANIGRRNYAGDFLLDSYLSRVCFIDGQALTPSSFGYQNTEINEWVSKSQAQVLAVVEAGGTNSFMLDFDDATSLTTLGYDKSTKNNDWTLNNVSLTSGVTYDHMLDVPGNSYATLNPIWAVNAAGNVFADGNLKCSTDGSSSTGRARCSVGLPTTGKFYCEMRPTDFVCSTSGASTSLFGILNATASSYIAFRTISSASSSLTGTNIYKDGADQGSITTLALNDVLGIAVDCGANSVELFVNNTLKWSGSYTVSGGGFFFGFEGDSGTADRASVTEYNFGQRPFSYTPPTGYLALCQANLPDPAILNPELHFDVKLHTGTGSGKSITGLGFQPDLYWGKSRNATYMQDFVDSVRGVTKHLRSDATSAEADLLENGGKITSFNSDGYTLANGTVNNSWNNETSVTYVNWLWKANGAGVSNTDGSITSTVSANPTAGFSIVTYTGTGANATVGHGLGVAPKMVIVKDRDTAGNNWKVWHQALAGTEYLLLNLTNAKSTAAATWNSTTPTSTVFSLGTDTEVNGTGLNVAYCFAEVPGFSKIGSYTANNSPTDGPYVHCGFRPKYLMIKSSTYAGTSWELYDVARSTYNAMTDDLRADSSAAAPVTSAPIDVTANGFKIRSSNANLNNGTDTYIFLAIADVAGKYALAR